MYVPTSISLPPLNKEIFTYQVSHYIYQLQNIQTAFLLKIRNANFHNVFLKLFLSLINILDSNSNINFHCHVIINKGDEIVTGGGDFGVKSSSIINYRIRILSNHKEYQKLQYKNFMQL